MSGDSETGVSVFRLVPELDAGPVFAMERVRIGANQTAGRLLDQLAEQGARLLTRVVDSLADGTARAEEQTGEPTLAPKLTIADGAIDWAMDADAVDAGIRGATPEPGAFTMLDDERLKVLEAAIAHGGPSLPPGRIEERGGRILAGTGTQALELIRVQPAGKRDMAAADWWRGRDGRPVQAG
jgi:methionyl-tRNA formyltransferase